MPRNATVADGMGERWLAEQRGASLSPSLSARLIDRQDSMRFGRHGRVRPVSIQCEQIDVAASDDGEIDLDLVKRVKVELGAIADGLERDLSASEIAGQLGVSARTIQLRIRACREKLLREFRSGRISD